MELKWVRDAFVVLVVTKALLDAGRCYKIKMF